jgi:cell division protein FtsI/penicillin-binding protein 2
VVFLSFFNSNTIHTKTKERIQRGIIYDRRGMELAISQDSSTIGINPEEVIDTAFTASMLSPYVGIPAEKIEMTIKDRANYFLLKREIDNSDGKKIQQMNLPGVRREKEFRRVYPNGTLASNLLGFTGFDDDSALSGLEYSFNQELMTSSENYKNHGADVHLTIDSLIQYKLEASLGKAFIETKSKKAVGLLMDVHSGKVLAMASFPNFDPNRYYDYPADSTTNWAIRHVYEPGSTMKIFMAMILLNEESITIHDKFYCPGYVEFGDRLVRCGAVHGHVNLEEILQYSCNVGIIKAIQKVPDAKLYQYLSKYKFGQKVGITVGENKGYFPELKKWTPSTAYFMAIGQGISVTPIQLVTSAAAVVNAGKIHNPMIVSHITDKSGEVIKTYSPETVAIGLKPNTTKHLLSSLKKVVQMGTGKNAYLQDYAISGKTGTGQKAKPGKGYEAGLFSASFLGFFPADDPKIVGLILFDEPGGVIHSGGGIAAPVFKEVVESIIPIIKYGDQVHNYKLTKLNPTDPIAHTGIVPDLTGKTLKEVIKIANSYKVRYKLIGSGFVHKQDPEAGSSAQKKEQWIIHFKD